MLVVAEARPCRAASLPSLRTAKRCLPRTNSRLRKMIGLMAIPAPEVLRNEQFHLLVTELALPVAEQILCMAVH